MKGSIRLGRIAGIEIGIHYSWFVVLALVTWSLAGGLLPSLYDDWSTVTYWATGVLSALLLFASVLVHELAHSIVARVRGFPVEGITLFLLGGVSSLRAEARGPKDEFIISAVGPVASLVLAGLFWLILQGVNSGGTPISAVFRYLAFINLLLAAFNLLPAFPLDGGRVLRSAVWGATGNFSTATTIATRGGQFFGFLLIAGGVFQVFQGSLLGGLWFALIGWFLQNAANASRREMVIEARLRGVLVRDVMERDPETIGPEVSIADTVYEHFLRKGMRALPVCEGGSIVGIITLSDVKSVPRDQWHWVRVRDEMTPMPLWTLTPDDPVARALELLAEHTLNQAPVLERSHLVGLLTRAGIIEYIQRRRELGIERGI